MRGMVSFVLLNVPEDADYKLHKALNTFLENSVRDPGVLWLEILPRLLLDSGTLTLSPLLSRRVKMWRSRQRRYANSVGYRSSPSMTKQSIVTHLWNALQSGHYQHL